MKTKFNPKTVGCVKCWSCRRRIRRCGNFCYGCCHYVCLRCCDAHEHFLRGRHGRKAVQK